MIRESRRVRLSVPRLPEDMVLTAVKAIDIISELAVAN